MFACCVSGIVNGYGYAPMLSAQDRVRYYGNMSEFYMVKESRYGAYLYHAVEFRVGSNLAPDERAGGVDIKAEEGGVGTWCGVCACAACEKI